MDIDQTKHVLELAKRSFVFRCRFNVCMDEERVLVEVVDIHGRPMGAQATARTYNAAVDLLRVTLEERGPALPEVCTDSASLCLALEKSIARSIEIQRPRQAHTFGDFPRREVK
jgi:hypothetical protein